MIVVDDSARKRIFAALSDDYSRSILCAVMRGKKTAIELSIECEIPIATVYRRLEELLQADLIVRLRPERSNDGKWSEHYGSLIKSINVSLENGSEKIIVTPGRLDDETLTKQASSAK